MTTEGTSYQRLPFKSVKTMFITICVLGFLYLFIIPQYADYSDRTRVAEGLMMASHAKVAITEYYDKHQAFPPDNAAAGLADPFDLNGNGFKSIEIHTTGNGDDAKALITVTYNKKLYGGATMVLTSSPAKEGKVFSWICSSSTIPKRDWTPECRHSDTSHDSVVSYR